jgi:heavy metal sensor kinase
MTNSGIPLPTSAQGEDAHPESVEKSADSSRGVPSAPLGRSLLRVFPESVRLRLTCWYVLAFGGLLMAFSLYVLSSVSRDLREQFDRELLQTVYTTSSYFQEFAEKDRAVAGAQETVRELKLGDENIAIFRQSQLLATTTNDVVSLADSMRASMPSDGINKPLFATDGKTNTRFVALAFEVNSVRYTVAVAQSMLELTNELRSLRQIILLALPAALILAALGGFLLAGKSLKPVVAISLQAEQITAKNLNERLQIKSHDEFGRLAGVINALLSRLDQSFRVMREFMADASHELRTPLAIIHGEAEVSLSRERSPGEYKESLGVIRDNSKRMSVIVSDMLDLARADSGQQILRKEELYLDDLVTGCCRSAQPLARMNQIHLSCGTEQDISFHGDEELLKKMVMNLLYNAIQYTPAGGSVSVDLHGGNGCARLNITDTGIGIEAAFLPRVFDRFYRVAESRTRADGGSGLGLSIVKLAAESHGGTVSVISEPGRGSTFTVCLPLEKEYSA